MSERYIAPDWFTRNVFNRFVATKGLTPMPNRIAK
jgi:hypothetical protein